MGAPLPPLDRKAPAAISTPFPTGGLDGKAFLMDIDNKFETQDKLINYLVN